MLVFLFVIRYPTMRMCLYVFCYCCSFLTRKIFFCLNGVTTNIFISMLQSKFPRDLYSLCIFFIFSFFSNRIPLCSHCLPPLYWVCIKPSALESGTFVTWPVCRENQSGFLCMRRLCVLPLSHLTSPQVYSYGEDL